MKNVSQVTQEKTATSSALRLRRPSWRDPRLLVGLLIVLLSAAGVMGLLVSQDRTVAVYAAERPLSTGDQLSTEDLRTVRVRIPDAAQHYLSGEQEVPEGMRLTRRVEAGELLPASALAEEDPSGRQAVTVQVDHDLARAVQPGRLVDVWAVTPAASAEQEPDVALLAAGAEVTDIRESSSAFGTSGWVTVEMLVTAEELTDLLAATGSGAVVSVVPAGEDAV